MVLLTGFNSALGQNSHLQKIENSNVEKLQILYGVKSEGQERNSESLLASCFGILSLFFFFTLITTFSH